MIQTKQIKFFTIQKNWKESMDEIMDIPINADPRKEVEKILIKFNEEEMKRHKKNPETYAYIPRELVSIESETGVVKNWCKWNKVNMMSILKNNESYDIMYCDGCKEFKKRYGLGEGFPYERLCHPETFCVDCNKRFKTEKGLLKHKERNNHKQPEWLPDGV